MNIIYLVIEFFRYRSVSWMMDAFDSLSQLAIPLVFIFIVLGKIKNRQVPVIVCTAYFVIKLGLNLFFSLFALADEWKLDIITFPLLALLFFALSLSNDPHRPYHPRWLKPDDETTSR